MKNLLRFPASGRYPSIGITLAITLLAGIALWSLTSIEAFLERARWVDHTHRVLFHLEQVDSLAKDAELGAAGFASAGAPLFASQFEASRNEALVMVGKLRSLTADNPAQQRGVALLDALARSTFVALQDFMWSGLSSDGRSPPGPAAPGVRAGGPGRIADRLHGQIQALQNVESRLLAERSADAEARGLRAKVLIFFGTTLAIVVLCAAFWLLARQIRERRLADAALAAANATLGIRAGQLEVANQELESFSYSISHDLRIPLRAVSGYARMLEEDHSATLDAEGRRLVGVISDNARRMGHLIDDLLTFSRLGRKTIAVTETDMNALARTALNDVLDGGKAGAASVRIDALPATRGDRSLLHQVWVNLIANALKYSSKKAEPVIEITGRHADTETVYAVRDNGVGFDMQYYDKLFGVFQRLHAAEEFPGTGVGLAIVHRIIVRLGGRVWAEGKINDGATFYFALPRTRDADA